jgi:hypothetical protein
MIGRTIYAERMALQPAIGRRAQTTNNWKSAAHGEVGALPKMPRS